MRAVGALKRSLQRLAQHNRAFELAAHLLDFLLLFITEKNRRAGQFTCGRGRPRFGIADERHVARLDHFDGEFVERPAAPEFPRFLARIVEAPGFEFGLRIIGGGFECGRGRQTRADVFGEVAEGLDNL